MVEFKRKRNRNDKMLDNFDTAYKKHQNNNPTIRSKKMGEETIKNIKSRHETMLGKFGKAVTAPSRGLANVAGLSAKTLAKFKNGNGRTR